MLAIGDTSLTPATTLFYARHRRQQSMKPSENAEQRDLFRGALEIMILQSLQRRPMHGYALVQHIKQRSNELLLVEEGSLYPALQRLLRQGFVKAEWQISSTGRRVRTYRIISSGEKHLEREVSLFNRMLKGISLVLAPVKS
jgi:PadR family transcriptional regulator